MDEFGEDGRLALLAIPAHQLLVRELTEVFRRIGAYGLNHLTYRRGQRFRKVCGEPLPAGLLAGRIRSRQEAESIVTSKSNPIFRRVKPCLRAGFGLRRAPAMSRTRLRRSADPTHPLDVRKDREASVGTQAEPGPDRLGVGPVDAERLADQECFGDLPALPARIVPALAGQVGVDLVGAAPGSAVAAPGAVVARASDSVPVRSGSPRGRTREQPGNRAGSDRSSKKADGSIRAEPSRLE